MLESLPARDLPRLLEEKDTKQKIEKSLLAKIRDSSYIDAGLDLISMIGSGAAAASGTAAVAGAAAGGVGAIPGLAGLAVSEVVSVVADLINAVRRALRGEYFSAALYTLFAVPLIGDALMVAKSTSTGVKATITMLKPVLSFMRQHRDDVKMAKAVVASTKLIDLASKTIPGADAHTEGMKKALAAIATGDVNNIKSTAREVGEAALAKELASAMGTSSKGSSKPKTTSKTSRTSDAQISESTIKRMVREEAARVLRGSSGLPRGDRWIRIDEAIIDVPSEKLSDIFDESGAMNQKVVDTVKDAYTRLQEWLKETFGGKLKVTEVFVVGAAVTLQFAPKSDIDTTMVIPGISPEQMKEVDAWMEDNLVYPNWTAGGSNRPFQFKPNPTNQNYVNVDAAYDPFKKEWIKAPDVETTKQQYQKLVADPESQERKTYAAIERTIQPSLQRLYDALDEGELNESILFEAISDDLKELMKSAYNRYEILKSKRKGAYEEDPGQTGRISQNWGTGNIIYKFLDREGYNDVYGDLKKAIKSNFEMVDDEFLSNLKQKLARVLSSEAGYAMSEARKRSGSVVKKGGKKASAGSVAIFKKAAAKEKGNAAKKKRAGFDAVKKSAEKWADDPSAVAQATTMVATGKPVVAKGEKRKLKEALNLYQELLEGLDPSWHAYLID
jgi:hypothetical protein